jgi:hypothetical protein
MIGIGYISVQLVMIGKKLNGQKRIGNHMKFRIARLSSTEQLDYEVKSLEHLMQFIKACDDKLESLGKTRDGVAIHYFEGEWWIIIMD